MKNSKKTLRSIGRNCHFFLLPFLLIILTSAYVNEPLTANEKESLVYTIEEARLTRDINAFLYDKWDEPIFDYVMTQENNNIFRLQKFIKEQGGQDPLARSIKGTFNIPSMQQEYNKLMNIGKNSRLAAYYVSMTLQEKNYMKMQERIQMSENLQMIKLYGKRMEKSGDHIRILFKNLQKLDVDYEAQYMTKNEFMDIIQPDILLDDVSM